MTRHLETVEDVERAFGMGPQASQEPAGEDAPFIAAKPTSDHAFPLSRSYEVRGLKFSTIALRPPTGHEYWEIGDPAEWQVMDGAPVRFRNLPALRAYAERCASVPGVIADGSRIIEALDIRDTLAVRRAIEGFFTEPAGSPSE